jgi:hypothetical protein
MVTTGGLFFFLLIVCFCASQEVDTGTGSQSGQSFPGAPRPNDSCVSESRQTYIRNDAQEGIGRPMIIYSKQWGPITSPHRPMLCSTNDVSQAIQYQLTEPFRIKGRNDGRCGTRHHGRHAKRDQQTAERPFHL